MAIIEFCILVGLAFFLVIFLCEVIFSAETWQDLVCLLGMLFAITWFIAVLFNPLSSVEKIEAPKTDLIINNTKTEKE